MKKIILTVLIICGLILLISSCGNDSNNETVSPSNEHVHKFSETYSYDKTKHWKDCSCGEKNNEGEHLFGAWILVEDSSNEESKKRICSICGYEQIKDEEASEHTHMFSAEWKKDDTYHWNECSCGEKTNIEIHNGALNRNCKCGYLITGSEGLNYTLLADDTYEVSGIGEYKDSNIVIPRIYDGRIVTSIGYNAFSGCSSLTSIIIPNSVTSIGSYAFECCSSLTSIEIPNSVTIIASGAFRECSSLTSITIPNSVTSIGDYAFSLCSSLTSIEIPNSVTNIVSGAFSGCSSLTSITIPNSVRGIEIYAFSGCSSLTSIEIPNSVTSIGSFAFSGCSSLTSIEIPNSVTIIAWHAFEGCSSLTSITIPNSVTSIVSGAFSGCSSLVYNEYDNAYYLGNDTNPYLVLVKAKSTEITSCKINENTKIIVSHAFRECSSLTSIEIPNSETSIDGDAFSGCSSLVYNEYDNAYYLGNDNNPYLVLVEAKSTEITSCKINENTKIIFSHAFRECSSLISIEIPNSVTSIGLGAFDSCSSLTSITIPNSVTSIGVNAFRECSSLVYNEYDNAYYLGNDTNPYLVLVDAKSRDITSCKINENTKIIFLYAFSRCSSLTSITIPNSVTSIGDNAFEYCSSLTSVTIGNSVTSIGYDAFRKCSSLTSVYYKGTSSEWNSISINYFYNLNLINTNRYYYSETKPTDTINKYWHYVDGVITIW